MRLEFAQGDSYLPALVAKRRRFFGRRLPGSRIVVIKPKMDSPSLDPFRGSARDPSHGTHTAMALTWNHERRIHR